MPDPAPPQPETGPARTPTPTPAPALAAARIVEDGATTAAGQLTRGQFLAQLRSQVVSATAAALGPEWSVAGCPYIEAWFAAHGRTPADELERMARRYSGLATPGSATDYMAPIVSRIGRAAARWRAGEDVAAELAAAELPVSALPSPSASPPGGGPPVQAFHDPSAPAAAPHPAAVAARLGPGAPLSGATAGRMESGFGASLSQVRVHTDAEAGRLAQGMGALAFTVGSDVAFAPGLYRPGTVAGDALLAHELAHVMQQQGRDTVATGGPSERMLEGDADQAAAGILANLYGQGAERAVPRMRSGGLALSRCDPDQRPSPTGIHYAESGSLPARTNAGDWGFPALTRDTASTHDDITGDLRALNAGGVYVYFGHATLSRAGGSTVGISSSDGSGHHVTVAELERALTGDNDPPTMVVLGGCQTGDLLVRLRDAGVPVVVGVTTSVSAIGAAAALQAFMTALASGSTFDAAARAANRILDSAPATNGAQLSLEFGSGYDGSQTLAAARAAHRGTP